MSNSPKHPHTNPLFVAPSMSAQGYDKHSTVPVLLHLRIKIRLRPRSIPNTREYKRIHETGELLSMTNWSKYTRIVKSGLLQCLNVGHAISNSSHSMSPVLLHWPIKNSTFPLQFRIKNMEDHEEWRKNTKRAGRINNWFVWSSSTLSQTFFNSS